MPTENSIGGSDLFEAHLLQAIEKDAWVIETWTNASLFRPSNPIDVWVRISPGVDFKPTDKISGMATLLVTRNADVIRDSVLPIQCVYTERAIDDFISVDSMGSATGGGLRSAGGWEYAIRDILECKSARYSKMLSKADTLTISLTVDIQGGPRIVCPNKAIKVVQLWSISDSGLSSR